MKIACVILASGKGSRFGKSKSKLFYKVYGTPLIEFTLKNMSKYINKNSIYITIPKKITKNEKNVLSKYTSNNLIYGSNTRFASLKNSLDNIDHKQYDYVLIHDGARPLTPGKSIKKMLKVIKCGKYDGCVLSTVVDDTLRKKKTTLNRKEFSTYQTPQIFNLKLFEQSIKKIKELPTDDFGVIEKKKNLKIKHLDSSKENIKITKFEDINLFKKLIKHKIKYGNGFDIHKLKEGKYLSLAGLKIKCGLSAIGHSDGDVVLHSIIDSLLGGDKKADIGTHFPAINKYKDISSIKLLDSMKRKLNYNNLIIDSLDCTIICQKVRLEKHKKVIAKNIAKLLRCNIANINVKAKTSDNIGSIGRSRAIACWTTIKFFKV